MGKSGRNRIDLTSKRFGRLSVLKEIGQNKGKAFLKEINLELMELDGVSNIRDIMQV